MRSENAALISGDKTKNFLLTDLFLTANFSYAAAHVHEHVFQNWLKRSVVMACRKLYDHSFESGNNRDDS